MFLIDTNAVSEFIKPAPNPSVVGWFRRARPSSLFVSVVTVGELRLGVEALSLGKRRVQLERWLDDGLPEWFAANLLVVNKEVANRWGRITIHAKHNGVTLSTTDGLIAATAIENNLTLVTRNTKDFTGLGVTLFNPWDSQP